MIERLAIVLAGLMIAAMLTAEVAVYGYEHCGECGVLPVKPIPPVGCHDLYPECVCDASGSDCHWQWVCEP